MAYDDNLHRLRETDCMTTKIVNREITAKENVAYGSQALVTFPTQRKFRQPRTNDPKRTPGEIDVHTGES